DAQGNLAIELAAAPLTSTAAAIDFDRAGAPDLVGASGANLFAWHVGSQLRANHFGGTAPAPVFGTYPQKLAGPLEGDGLAVADLDGDHEPEVVAPSGYLLFALDRTGHAPTRWPRFIAGNASHAP